ncbi:unnamed protein product, partial [Rotaria sp. Silwood2]
FNRMECLLFVTSITILFFLSYTYAQQCEQPLNVARFNCYPETDPTMDKCLERKCCWYSFKIDVK